MLKQVSKTVYHQVVPRNLFNDDEYLLITSKVVKCDVVYYLYYKKEEPVVAFALFVSNKRIILPHFQFLYTDVWLKYPLEKKYSRDYLFESLKSLKTEYNSIKLMLPPDIKDVRPFLWNGFSISNRYTYQKVTSNYHLYKDDVKTNYQRALKRNLEFSTLDFVDFHWMEMRQHLINIGYSNKDVRAFEDWFKQLNKNNLLCVEIYSGGKSVGGSIILVDKPANKAYLLLVQTMKGITSKEANAFLYIEITKYLNSLGIKYLDFMGANIRSIADFKYRFMPELTPYFLVEFKREWFDFSKTKRLVKAILVKYFKF
jgi:hypothetical protein